MSYQNMTPLGPDHKYIRYLKEEFGLTDENIVKAEQGQVRCYRLGKPEIAKTVVIEVKGKGTEDIYHMQEGLTQKFLRRSGVLLNVQYYERANRDAPEPQTVPRRAVASQPVFRQAEAQPELSFLSPMPESA